MFNKKYKNRILELQKELEDEKARRSFIRDQFMKSDLILKREIEHYKNKINTLGMAELMRESLGMSVDFSTASSKGLPRHYLEDMGEEERKNFVNHMETIYKDSRFDMVVRYLINLFAMNAIFKADPQEMKNGQTAVVAIRTLLKELDKMHTEFLGYKKQEGDGYDPLGILPE